MFDDSFHSTQEKTAMPHHDPHRADPADTVETNTASTFVFGDGKGAAEAHRTMIPIEQRYQLRKVIAKGGMGCVYEAWDMKLKRPVAVKVMDQALASIAGARERFLRELAVQARLSNPYLIAAYDGGEGPQGLFIVMPLVEGQTLKARLVELRATKQSLKVRTGLAVMRDVVKGLSFMHAEGVIHRDIKPSNIMLPASSEPVAQLFDLGIARSITDEERLTITGAVPGTFGYMSPEQSLGVWSINHLSDLFSFGVVAWEMFVGEHPSQYAVRSSSGSQMSPVCVIRPDVPKTLSDLIDELMQLNPNQRPQSANAVLTRLNGISEQLASTDAESVAVVRG